MDLEANRHHLWVITISIITSLLLHLMICFAKGITFWIWVCTMGVGGQAEINQADVFLLPSICFLKKCAWWCSCWPMIILPGVFEGFHWDWCEPQGNTQNQNLSSMRFAGLQSAISSVLKCEGDVMSVILTGVWAAGRNWKGVSQIDHRRNKWHLRALLRFTECLWIGLKCS